MSKHRVDYKHYDKDHPYLSTLSIKKRANYDRTQKIALRVVILLFFILAGGMLMWATADSSVSYSPLQKEASATARPIRLSKVEVKLSEPPPPLLYSAGMYLIIPRLNINVPIGDITIVPDAGLVIPPAPNQAFWRKDGPKPGETGSVIIAGPYGELKDDGAFSSNDKLVVGDSIEVIYNGGNRASYKVYKIAAYKVAEVPLKDIFDKSDGKYLNLLTSTGLRSGSDGSYDQRLVVYARQE